MSSHWWNGVGRAARGFAFYLLLAFVIGFFIYLRLGELVGSLAAWLSRSNNPRYALLSFSGLVASILLILTRFGFEINFLNRWIPAEKVRAYLAGLPLWVLIPLATIQALIFWQYFPSCLPPLSVQFAVAGTDRIYPPGALLEVKAGEGLTLIAETPEHDPTLSCYWEYSGSVFSGTKSQPSACYISLKFNHQGGQGVITVATTQGFCSQKSLFSLEIRVVP
ncbi:MAG: hypothetical protein ACK4VW_04160 [Anaerolineales bacterium]